MKSEDRLLVVMVVSIFLGYMPWYGFSAVSSPMCQEFGLTTSDMGLILAVFQLGYVLTVIASGMLADRIGNKPVLVGATLATGIFSLLFALFSRGFLSILVFRLLTGLSAGAIYAPGMSLLSSWYSPPQARHGPRGIHCSPHRLVCRRIRHRRPPCLDVFVALGYHGDLPAGFRGSRPSLAMC